MSRYVLAHIELPLEVFPDGTHKIYNEHSHIYFETLGRLPPKQTNTQFDLGKILGLSTQSPQHDISKVLLEEIPTNGDADAILFRTDIAKNTKVLEQPYVVHKHEILPRRAKSDRYTFRLRPTTHKSSLYSRRERPTINT